MGWQGNLNLYYFEIRIKSFLFGFLQNQREIAENYPNFLKTQKALLPVEMSNFNPKKNCHKFGTSENWAGNFFPIRRKFSRS